MEDVLKFNEEQLFWQSVFKNDTLDIFVDVFVLLHWEILQRKLSVVYIWMMITMCKQAYSSIAKQICIQNGINCQCISKSKVRTVVSLVIMSV